MSIARHFLRDMRPLFHLLDEPFRAAPSLTAFPRTSLFADPFFGSGFQTRSPAVDLSEEGSQYIVEAEMPGVKKENINIEIGDNGHSVTIAGKTFSRSSSGSEEAPKPVEGQSQESGSSEASGTTTNAMTTSESSTQLSSERVFSGSSSFSRTVWLPRRVDGSNVSANLSDGILTLRIPKAEDKESVRISID